MKRRQTKHQLAHAAEQRWRAEEIRMLGRVRPERVFIEAWLLGYKSAIQELGKCGWDRPKTIGVTTTSNPDAKATVQTWVNEPAPPAVRAIFDRQGERSVCERGAQ